MALDAENITRTIINAANIIGPLFTKASGSNKSFEIPTNTATSVTALSTSSFSNAVQNVAATSKAPSIHTLLKQPIILAAA